MCILKLTPEILSEDNRYPHALGYWDIGILGEGCLKLAHRSVIKQSLGYWKQSNMHSAEKRREVSKGWIEEKLKEQTQIF